MTIYIDDILVCSLQEFQIGIPNLSTKMYQSGSVWGFCDSNRLPQGLTGGVAVSIVIGNVRFERRLF